MKKEVNLSGKKELAIYSFLKRTENEPKPMLLDRLLFIMVQHNPAQILDLLQKTLVVLVRRRQHVLWMNLFLGGQQLTDLLHPVGIPGERRVAVFVDCCGELFGSEVFADVACGL